MIAGSRILPPELKVLRLLLLGLPSLSLAYALKRVDDDISSSIYVSLDPPSTDDTWVHVCSHMGQEELV